MAMTVPLRKHWCSLLINIDNVVMVILYEEHENTSTSIGASKVFHCLCENLNTLKTSLQTDVISLNGIQETEKKPTTYK